MNLFDLEVIYIGKRSKVLSRVYKSLPRGEIFSLNEAINQEKKFHNKIVILFSLPYKNKEKEYFNFLENLNCKLFINVSSICALNINYKSKIGRYYQINKSSSHLMTEKKENSINIICASFIENSYDVSDPSLGVYVATEYRQFINTINNILKNYLIDNIKTKNIFCFRIYGRETLFSVLIKSLRDISNFFSYKLTLFFDLSLKFFKINNRFYTNESNSYCSQSLQIGKITTNINNNFLSEIFVNKDNYKKSFQKNLIDLKDNLLRIKYINFSKFSYEKEADMFIINGVDIKTKKEIYLFSNRIVINNKDKNFDELLDNLLLNNKLIYKFDNNISSLADINLKNKKLIIYE